ncbi:hypothetical protein PV326_013734 [Microctonus aethiopoides]|nr:hypothetical protein PV326_013734 [Microctonus aethiopoides]
MQDSPGALIGTCSEKLVIDTDAGADDATGILLVLSAWIHDDSNFELIAITCTYGNTVEENVQQNVLKTLTIANATHIPVYGGAQKPLANNYTSDNYFGKDGFGDFVMDEKITAKVNDSYKAAVALVNLAKNYPKELNILALGPLTNIALAISLDANFVHNVKKFYIMGGSVTGLGNYSPGVEYNFACDPVSNFIVLQSMIKPSMLYPWETVVQSNISKKWRMDKLGSIDSKIIRFLNKAEDISLSAVSTWRPADAMAAAAMMWPKLINKSEVLNVMAVMDGEAKGSLLVDYYNVTGKLKNVEIVQNLNIEAFQDKILHHFS